MVATTQEIVYAFMQTYYQRMKENPTKLANLYSNTAELTHINYNQITTINHEDTAKFSILPTIKLIGKENINKFFTRHSDKVQNLKVKVDTCDFQSTGITHKSILIIITGELFWTNTKTHHYLQTFILTPVSKNSEIYDISNDVIRFIPTKSHKHEKILMNQNEEIEGDIRKEETLENNKGVDETANVNEKEKEKEKEAVTNNDETKKNKDQNSVTVDVENVRSNSPTPSENVSQHTGDHKRTSSKHHKRSDSVVSKKDNILTGNVNQHPEATEEGLPEPSNKLANEVKVDADSEQDKSKALATKDDRTESNNEPIKPQIVTNGKEKAATTSTNGTIETTAKNSTGEAVNKDVPAVAPLVKLSWASKLSSFEPNKKIVVDKPSMGTTTVETNNTTSYTHKKDNNNNNNNNNSKNRNNNGERKSYDMNNRKENMSNRKDKKGKLIFSNVNKDGYYPIYINGTSGLSEDDIRNALVKEFGTIVRISVGDNFAVVDFQHQQSQINAIDRRKLIVKNSEISLERKTMKKNNNNNNGQQQNGNFVKSNKKFNNSMSNNNNNNSRKREIDNM